MKWKITLSLLFIIATIGMLHYANKPLVSYNRTFTEDTPDGNGVYFKENVTKNFQDNYGAIGGAIGFGILATGSLISFFLLLKKEQD